MITLIPGDYAKLGNAATRVIKCGFSDEPHQFSVPVETVGKVRCPKCNSVHRVSPNSG